MVFTKDHRLPKTVGRCIQLADFELSQTYVEVEIPIFYSECRGGLILAHLRLSVAHHSFSKAQVVMSERVVRMFAYQFGVKTNRLRVVFDAQRIVRADVADLL